MDVNLCSKSEDSSVLSRLSRCFTKQTQVLLLLLLAADSVFFAMNFYILAMFWLSLDSALPLTLDSSPCPKLYKLYLVSIDRSYAEFYQYTKELWISLMLVMCATHRTRFNYLAWAVLFSYLLLDDCFSIHERVGLWLSQRLEFDAHFGLRPEDFGELAVIAIAGSLFSSGLALGYYKSNVTDRFHSRVLLVLTLILAGFGVVFDVVDSMVHSRTDSKELRFLFEFAEDGGEMLVMSFLVAYVFNLASRSESPAVSS